MARTAKGIKTSNGYHEIPILEIKQDENGVLYFSNKRTVTVEMGGIISGYGTDTHEWYYLFPETTLLHGEKLYYDGEEATVEIREEEYEIFVEKGGKWAALAMGESVVAQREDEKIIVPQKKLLWEGKEKIGARLEIEGNYLNKTLEIVISSALYEDTHIKQYLKFYTGESLGSGRTIYEEIGITPEIVKNTISVSVYSGYIGFSHDEQYSDRGGTIGNRYYLEKVYEIIE